MIRPSSLAWLLWAIWVTLPAGVRAAAGQPPASQATAPDRFSPLAQIDRSNVAHLRLKLTFRSGQRGAQGAAPLVVGSTIYILTPFPHVLFALDLTRPAAPVKWRFAPEPDSIAAGLTCCDRLEHGPVYAKGRLYFSTLDGRVIALDAETGGVAWNVRVADPHNGETLVSAPEVVGSELVIGNGGDEFGARGWIMALDAATGQQIWKHYSTGPDSDVGIDPAGDDLGTTTWPAGLWQHGGGSVSAPVLYLVGRPPPL